MTIGASRKLTKFYVALVKVIEIQAKIENLVTKYNMLAIADASVQEQILKLTFKLNQLTCHMNAYKKALGI